MPFHTSIDLGKDVCEVKKILVPVDGSKPSKRALDQAIAIIEGKEADYALTLVYVSPDSLYFPYYSMGASQIEGLDDEVTEVVEKESSKLLESVKREIANPAD